MSTHGFSCPWDSGQVGFIYILKADACKEYGIKYITKKWVDKLEQYLNGDVEAYDHYIKGEVYGYSIKNSDEVYDSCGGFIGDDLDTNGMLDYIPAELHAKTIEAYDNIQYM